MVYNPDSIKKILIPTDGGDTSVRAAEYGIGIAKTHNAQVTTVFVVDEVVVDQFSKVTEREAVEHELKNNGKRYTQYVVNLAEKQGVQAASMLIRGRPFEQIVNLAKGLDVDLIVMGTYGRRGSERILIGSVAQSVIEYSSCPVLVVK